MPSSPSRRVRKPRIAKAEIELIVGLLAWAKGLREEFPHPDEQFPFEKALSKAAMKYGHLMKKRYPDKINAVMA